ncbi:MAG TPA: ROK family transcriptional regulator [Spirochaetia bacterium]|nr:ROK family transcriptional regulator [Spirochaetia bacterium]
MDARIFIPKNAKEQRRENAAFILRVIRDSDGISRAKLAKKTGLSMPSVSKIISYLEDLGLLELQMRSGNNQKQIPFYTFKGGRYGALGLEIGRRDVVGIGCDLSGRIFGEFCFDYHDGNLEHLIDRSVERIRHLLTDAEREGLKILGLGIGSPGPIDPDERVILTPPYFYGWRDIPIGSLFESRLGIPVLLEKAPNLSALAEGIMGAGRGMKNLIFMDAGEGIGTGIIYKGKIFHGNSEVYCSLGHTTVDIRGPVCDCGNRGCLEVYTKESVVTEKVSNAKSPEDKETILKEAAEYLSAGVANLINLFGIKTVVIGGDTVDAHEKLFEYMVEDIPGRAFPSLHRKIKILRSTLHNRSEALGGALWIGELALLNLNSPHFNSEPPRGHLLYEGTQLTYGQ